jgi:uncharacterized membrane protein YfcA
MLARRREPRTGGGRTSGDPPTEPFAAEDRGRLAGRYREPGRIEQNYAVRRIPLGGGLAGMAGVLSGLLGVGGGFVKVPTMRLVMGVPMRVATATSNFMVGITAASGLLVYFARGDLRPLLAAPVVLGTLLGAQVGTKAAGRLQSQMLSRLFAGLLAGIVVVMALIAAGVLHVG